MPIREKSTSMIVLLAKFAVLEAYPSFEDADRENHKKDLKGEKNSLRRPSTSGGASSVPRTVFDEKKERRLNRAVSTPDLSHARAACVGLGSLS